MIAVDASGDEHEVEGPEPGDKVLLDDGLAHIDEHGAPRCYCLYYFGTRMGERADFDPEKHEPCFDCYGDRDEEP